MRPVPWTFDRERARPMAKGTRHFGVHSGRKEKPCHYHCQRGGPTRQHPTAHATRTLLQRHRSPAPRPAHGPRSPEAVVVLHSFGVVRRIEKSDYVAQVNNAGDGIPVVLLLMVCVWPRIRTAPPPFV